MHLICFTSAVHKVGYNFAMEVPIKMSIIPINAQLNAHSDGTNNSICTNIPIRSVFPDPITYAQQGYVFGRID